MVKCQKEALVAFLIKILLKHCKMALKFNEIDELTNNLFVITVILIIFDHYKHEIIMITYAKPNQKLAFVHYNREFAIAVIVIT
jgi:hypothetical protein